MKKKITISLDEFGLTITNYIGLKNRMSFFPYRITASSFILNDDMVINISDKPLSTSKFSKDFSNDYRGDFPEECEITLTKSEVYEAISMRIQIFFFHEKFKGNCVESTSFNFPDEVTFRIKLIPKGTSKKISTPILDGSLKS